MPTTAKGPTCPQCNEGIDYLIGWQTILNAEKVTLSANGSYLVFDAVIPELPPRDNTRSFECPHCGGVLARRYVEAERLLKGSANT